MKTTSDDLSTTSSLSSSSQSLSSVRKKTCSHRTYSPPQLLSSLSNDFKIVESKQSYQIRPHSALALINQSHYSSPPHPPPPTLPSSSSSSICCSQLTNQANQSNSYGLTKTISYVWKNTNKNVHDEGDDHYPCYSIEQIPPLIKHEQRSIPMLSRTITLERSQIDYWQNYESSPDCMITASCQNLTGSASHLFFSSSSIEQTQTHTDSQGHIISVTTMKRHQPSLLNKSINIRWGVKEDGKLFRYPKAKWHSDHQLHKQHCLKRKYRTEYVINDNNNDKDRSSSSERNHRSAPLIIHHENKINAHQGMTITLLNTISNIEIE